MTSEKVFVDVLKLINEEFRDYLQVRGNFQLQLKFKTLEIMQPEWRDSSLCSFKIGESKSG